LSIKYILKHNGHYKFKRIVAANTSVDAEIILIYTCNRKKRK